MKKIGLLVISLILVMGSLGITYAMWSDTVTLDVDITSGNVCLKFCQCTPLDTYMPPPYYPTGTPDWGVDPGFTSAPYQLDKNVSWMTCGISTDGKLLTFVVNNTYPCNYHNLSFYLQNCGTVPVKIECLRIYTADPLTGAQPVYTICNSNQAGGILYFDFNGDGCNDLEMLYGNNWGAQLDPGNLCGSPEFSFRMHTLQCAPQGATYQFWMTVTGIQYNEYDAVMTTTTTTTNS